MIDKTQEHEVDHRIIDLMSSDKTANDGLRLLMSTYQVSLYHHIKGLVGSHHDANDVLQNTFVKVYRNISSFKQQSKLYTWLYRIATNESLTFIKRRTAKRTEALEDVSTKATSVRHKAIDGNFIQSLVTNASTILPHKQRVVFQLRYYDEMSYEDIHQITGTSIGALKASYHHAVKKVEAYIKTNAE